RDGSIHLHCRTLSFIHPVKNEPVTIVAPPPTEEIWNLFSDFWED
ncbi:MAG: RNA pseudouridine synthase, partial [Bacteroidota bacterium]